MAAAMTRRDRLRRVALLCASFARNLAYYRAGQGNSAKMLFALDHPHAGFWRQANGNFLDLCVLEWCKLFGERTGKHFWRQIVTEPEAFEAGLLARVRMTTTEFGNLVAEVRSYRDKFVAHLDSDFVMNIPTLSAAQASVWFYHEHIVQHEATAGELAGLPMATASNLERGYAQCSEEAEEVYQYAASRLNYR